MPRILDVEAALLLLELEPPFDQRAVQLARRRMAKRWHPDIAPPGRRHEHQRHLQAINEAADELERLAESSRGGKVSRNAVKASAAATRRAREDAGRRAYENEQRAREQDADRAKHDPFGSRVPDHSVVHRYARCVSYPEWGVGTVSGIYFSGDEEASQQWARVMFSVGVRTVPAGSLQFVDFSKPDPAADRVERFMTAAQHALAEGDAALAAQRLVYARDAEPQNPMVLRLLTAAFWQAGNLPAAARTVRDWARVDTDRPTPERFASRIYEDMGALDLAAEAAVRAANRAPNDASAWERLGRLRLRVNDRAGAISALERARLVGPSVDGPARPRARPPPGRRRRRRGLRGPRGDPDRRGVAASLVGLRPRPGPHRSPGRVPRRVPPGAQAGQGRRGLPAAGPHRGGDAARAVRAQRRLRRRDRALAPAHGAGLLRVKRATATCRAPLDLLQDAEQLTDAADEQPLLVDLDPRARRGGEHDVVPRLDRHPHAHVVPPVQAGPDGEHDPVLGRRLVGARGHEQPGPADPVGIELLDDHAVEQWAELATHYTV